MPRRRDRIVEEAFGQIDMNPRPVAGLAVGIARAAVPDRAQRLDCRLDDAARWLAVGRRDQPDAPAIAFQGGPVNARFGGPRVPVGGELRSSLVPYMVASTVRWRPGRRTCAGG